MNSDSEFERVLSNPDNLIVSDSLKDRLDFGQSTPEDSEVSTNFIVGEENIPGRFRSYSIELDSDIEEIQISFICQKEYLVNLLQIRAGNTCSVDVLENNIVGTLLSMKFGFMSGEIQATVSLSQ